MFEGMFMAILFVGIMGVFTAFAIAHKDNKPFQIFFMLCTFATIFIGMRFATMTTEGNTSGAFSTSVKNDIVGSLTTQYGIFITIFYFFLILGAITLLFLTFKSFKGMGKRNAVLKRNRKEQELMGFGGDNDR